MTIKFLNRFFLAIAGLVLLFAGVCLFILALGIFPFSLNETMILLLKGEFLPWQRMAAIGIALALAALGLHGLSMLFRRSRDRGFVVQHTEYGDMNISLQAMESMVKKCVDTHEELKMTHARIHRNRDSVGVDIRVSLANGANIPLTVNALQKQIKHYITSCSGVDVKEVRVRVETTNHAPKSAEVIAPDLLAADASVVAQSSPKESFAPLGQPVVPPHAAAEAEVEKGAFHQRLFKHQDKPNIVPQPPAPVVEPAAPEEGTEEEPAMESPSEPAMESARDGFAPENLDPSFTEPTPEFQVETEDSMDETTVAPTDESQEESLKENDNGRA